MIKVAIFAVWDKNGVFVKFVIKKKNHTAHYFWIKIADKSRWPDILYLNSKSLTLNNFFDFHVFLK